jgi:glycerol-3-phosphate O-acyltransferase
LDRIAVDGLKNHSVYSIASRRPVYDWITQKKKHSVMLKELARAILQDDHLDICIIPVSVFWGRAIARQRHWLKVLFSDTWEVGGHIRKLFTLLVNGRQGTLIFQSPISFREMCQSAAYNTEFINDMLTGELQRQHEATYGPEIANLKHTVSRVINTDQVVQTIERQHREGQRNLQRGRKQAAKYAREIFSDCTQISQEIMKRLLSAFWNRYYSGILIFNMDPVKKIALTHQLVYVPCHRSHIDYLLLSYVLFTEGLALPYIAAGVNLNMPVIGRILRGGGAFFLRRSFRDNPLYAAVMSEYVRELVRLGVPVEYFIEGGRSRTGRLLKPKLGMLSMTVDGWLRSQSKPLAFVPVYIGYEKLVEGKSYIGELYGSKKRRESLWGSIRSILTLNGQFGKVTTSFGQPLEIEPLLDECYPRWRDAEVEGIKQTDWFRHCIVSLSHRIMTRINRAAVINPVNLIAICLLATRRQSIDESDLIRQCDFYRSLIKSQPQLDTITLQDRVDSDELHRIQQQGLLDIHDHELGNIVRLDPEHAILMSYYRNNCLHALIIPSVIACCFLNARVIEQSRLVNIVRYIYPFLINELHLPWSKNELEDFTNNIVSFLVKKQVLIKTSKQLKRPDRNDVHYMMLSHLAHIAQPVLERYYMAFVVLWESGSNPLTEQQLEQRCHLVAQKISMIYGINSPDFFDRQLFRHFIQTLIELEFIEHGEDGILVFQETFNQVNLDIRLLLSVEVRSTILQLLNHHKDLGPVNS